LFVVFVQLHFDDRYPVAAREHVLLEKVVGRVGSLNDAPKLDQEDRPRREWRECGPDESACAN
jgi:hypothetical protein